MDRSDFLDAIRAEPWDDGVRLRYADWLDDRGDLQGELIRVQCQLARLAPGDPAELELQSRQEVLCDQLADSALQVRLPDIPLNVDFPTRTLWNWHRGMFGGALGGRLTLPLALLGEMKPAILAQVPWLEKLCCHTGDLTPAELEEFAASDKLQGITHLVVWISDESDDLETLSGLGDAFVRGMSRSPYLSRLRRLEINGGMTDRGMGILAAAGFLTGLEHLRLASNRDRRHPKDQSLTMEGLSLLAASPLASNLRSLSLPSNPFDSQAGEILGQSPNLRAIISLNLRDCHLGNEGVMALTESPLMGRLKALHLGWNAVGPEGIPFLARSPAESLETLYLPGNPSSGGPFENFLPPHPLEAGLLASSRRLRNLRRLHLTNTGLGDPDFEAIALSTNFVHLEQLISGYGNQRVTDASLLALAGSKNLQSLRELVIGNGPGDIHPAISEKGAKALLESRYLSSLRRVRLTPPSDKMQDVLSREVRQALRVRFPDSLYPWHHG